MEQQEKTLWQTVKGYFNVLPDKEDEAETIQQISSGVTFHGGNLWVLIFAIFLASLGLNVNSTAVIIGAMLISPLMGPIIGMGLAFGINDLELLKRSIKNYLVATVISVLTATVYFTITPLTDAQSELLARTSPSLYDVLIALFGGAAGILALATKGKGNVIPGVAIATALMPPLCTAGYGLAVGGFSFFIGAFYLFFINTVFIALATFVGVRMLRFKRKKFIDPKRLHKARRYIIAVVILTMLPATYMTVQIIGDSVQDSNVRRFVKNELTLKGTQIISQNINEKKKVLDIVAVGRLIDNKTIQEATQALEQYHLAGYKLNVIQGSQSDSVLLASSAQHSQSNNRQLLEQSRQIHDLESRLNQYTAYEKMSGEIIHEMKAVWPEIEKISLSNATETRSDTTATSCYVIAVIGCRQRPDNKEQAQLQQWLKVRTKADSLRVIVTP